MRVNAELGGEGDYRSAVLHPAALRPGDVVRVVAPSGPFDRTLFFRGLGWLSRRYRVRWDRGCFARTGYLAGNDERRLAELDQALNDPLSRAIVAARGGYGASRICTRLDFGSLERHPKWLVGFSDFTAVHVELARLGIASLHGGHVTSLGRGDAASRELWCDALERPLARRRIGPLTRLSAGDAVGQLFGGNLSLLTAAAAAGRLRLPQRCVLFFEEVNEAPYRIDRMLTSLLVGGHLANAVAICVGDLTDTADPAREAAALAPVRDCLSRLGIPVATGLPIGHGRSNYPLICGARAWLRGAPAELIVEPHDDELVREPHGRAPSPL